MTLFARITGQIRAILLVAAIGATGYVADAFDVANNVPTTLNVLLTTGIFNAILVPTITKSQKFKNADERISKMITFAGSIIFLLTVVLTIFSAVIITAVASNDWGPQQRLLAVSFGFWCMPQVFFYGLYTLLGQVLASREKFVAYGFAPVFNNIISSLVLVAFILINGGFGNQIAIDNMTNSKIILLALGSTIAIAAQALILIIPLVRSGFRFKLKFGVHGFGLRNISKLAVWSFLMMLIEQLVALFCVKIVSGAPNAAVQKGLQVDEIASIGGNAAYTSAIVIFAVAHSLITVTLMTTLFTRISKNAATNNMRAINRDLLKGINFIILLITFATAVFLVLNVPIVRVLIPSAYSTSCSVIALGVAALSLKLIPAGVYQMTSRVFFALGKVRSLFIIEVPEHLILIVLVLLTTKLLDPSWWIFGVCLSGAVAYAFAAVMVLFAVKAQILKRNLNLKIVVRTLIKCLIAGAFSVLTGVLLKNLLFLDLDFSITSWGISLLAIVLIGSVMLFVYCLICRALKVYELEVLLRKVYSKMHKKS
jgi:putative peptidoglycan lipid II flippase